MSACGRARIQRSSCLHVGGFWAGTQLPAMTNWRLIVQVQTHLHRKCATKANTMSNRPCQVERDELHIPQHKHCMSNQVSSSGHPFGGSQLNGLTFGGSQQHVTQACHFEMTTSSCDAVITLITNRRLVPGCRPIEAHVQNMYCILLCMCLSLGILKTREVLRDTACRSSSTFCKFPG